MKRYISIIICTAICFSLTAQHYSDFIGAGHDHGIVVTTSHDENNSNDGNKTIDGFPVDDKLLLSDASRFLAQSTMGYDFETIETAAAMGFEKWLDEQYKIPHISAMEISDEVVELLGVNVSLEYGVYEFRSVWFNMLLLHPDLLRQRITHALSQIFVVSSFGDPFFIEVAELSHAHYDNLNRNAFGNFRDLLSDVSLSPSMGKYLSHMNNPRSDPANNVFPDENFAREVMQLFTIGLYELNNDGTRKLDNDGNFIPTYDNEDIGEFAKIFTGFGDGRQNGVFGVFDPIHARGASHIPMKVYTQWHEYGEKYLLNGQVVSEFQFGDQDFEDAMDNLFYHPNVGPFIGKKLIQFLVTSNPSSAYVNRVAIAFNDNGEGTRGDMKAVIKAILLDPEARECNPVDHPTAGKLREPLVRYTGYLRAFNASRTGDLIIQLMDEWYERTSQVPFYATSVFNFYSPEFQPNGPIADLDLVAPEFQIHNSITSIGYINASNDWALYDSPLSPVNSTVLDFLGVEEVDVVLNFDDERAIAEDEMALVERLDILLACGQLSQRTKNIIANAISQLLLNDDKVRFATYLILISPEYAVLK